MLKCIICKRDCLPEHDGVAEKDAQGNPIKVYHYDCAKAQRGKRKDPWSTEDE